MSYEKKVQIFIGNHNRKTTKIPAIFNLKSTVFHRQCRQFIHKDETIWCTQKAMAASFDVGVHAINKHLNNLYFEGEILREATVSKMEIVQLEGQRKVKRLTELYNLDAIISVGYRPSLSPAPCSSCLQHRQCAADKRLPASLPH